jgi:hypothetical protein
VLFEAPVCFCSLIIFSFLYTLWREKYFFIPAMSEACFPFDSQVFYEKLFFVKKVMNAELDLHFRRSFDNFQGSKNLFSIDLT